MKTKKSVKYVLFGAACTLMIGLGVGDYFAATNRTVISGFLGVGEQIKSDPKKTETSLKKGDEVVRKIAEEGFVLLKNEDKDGNAILPLNKEKNSKINLFGWGATDQGFLLSGNGSGRSKPYKDMKKTLLDAFREANVEINQKIIDSYNDFCPKDDTYGTYEEWSKRAERTNINEPSPTVLLDDKGWKDAVDFSDTALIVISRYSGEFKDNDPMNQKKRISKDGKTTIDSTRFYYDLSSEEEELVKKCTSSFKKTIVVFNTGSMMNMSFLEDEATFGHIDAAFNIGYVGQSGATALPKLIFGEVNPSAKMADTIVYDLKNDHPGFLSTKSGYRDQVVYSEGVYVGYKYFETADTEGIFNDRKRGDKNGYEAVVQYPFGYGLSYTDFSWEMVPNSLSLDEGSYLDKTSKIEFKVKVKNIGERAGKDVVGVYFTPPYYKGGVEKPSVNLLDFGKTPLLEPNEETVLTFSIDSYDLASYDAYGLNKFGYGSTGWILDPGDYEIRLQTDSHHLKEMEHQTLTYHVSDDMTLRFRRDPKTNERVYNRFTGEDAYASFPLDGSKIVRGGKNNKPQYLSRVNFSGTMPKKDESWGGGMEGDDYKNALGYIYTGYDNLTVMPTTNKVVGDGLYLVTDENGNKVSQAQFDGQAGAVKLKRNEELFQKLGSDYNAPEYETLLDQLTVEDLKRATEKSGYGTSSLESIGKARNSDQDGPAGFNQTNMSPSAETAATAFPAETTIAQTWSKELAYFTGSIFGSDAQTNAMSGIYAPSVNIHRDPINGRNYEYYSEDPIISGQLASNVILGAKSNGTYCYLKHFALFDSNVYHEVYTTEQALREIYLKAFEIPVKNGETNAVMTSFNMIANVWSGQNHALVSEILRGEWGFKGTVITDYFNGRQNEHRGELNPGLRGGNDTWLNGEPDNIGPNGILDTSDPVSMNLARNAVHNIVYTVTNTYYYSTIVENKSPYTAEVASPKTVEMGFEWWIPVVVSLNVAIGLLVIVSGYLAFKPEGFKLSNIYKKKKD